MTDPTDALTTSLRALFQFLLGNQTPRESLLQVARLGESALDGASATGITLLERGRPKTFVFTDDQAPEVDQLQYDEGTGPCLDAYRQQEIIRVDSNRTDQRWPTFCRRAAEQGILSSLSVPLVVDGQGIGAVNFYARAERAFGPGDEKVGAAFGEQAAVLWPTPRPTGGPRSTACTSTRRCGPGPSSSRPRAS